jgi:hypothetical protein
MSFEGASPVSLGGVALSSKNSRRSEANPIEKDCCILVIFCRSPVITRIHEWEGVLDPSRHISGSCCNNSCVGETFYMRGFDNGGRAAQPQAREAQPWDELNHVELRSEDLVTKRVNLDVGYEHGVVSVIVSRAPLCSSE